MLDIKLLSLIVLTFLVICFFVLLILVLTGVIHSYSSDSELEQQFLDDATAASGWGMSTFPVNTERGECLLYNTFSTNRTIVDSLTPIAKVDEIPPEFSCDDGFVKALSLYERICKADICIGYDGKQYRNGEYEYYYNECGDLSKCPNGRTVIILNYSSTSGKIDFTKSYCINSDTEGNFTVDRCTAEIVPTSTQFLNIDSQAYLRYLFLRIRAPGTVNCLNVIGGQIGSSECLESPNDGWGWVLIPQTTDANNPVITYPSQIIALPEGFSLSDIKDMTEEQFRNFINNLASIQTNSDYLYLGPYAACYSCEGGANPELCRNPPNCEASTGLVSAYSFLNAI